MQNLVTKEESDLVAEVGRKGAAFSSRGDFVYHCCMVSQMHYMLEIDSAPGMRA